MQLEWFATSCVRLIDVYRFYLVSRLYYNPQRIMPSLSPLIYLHDLPRSHSLNPRNSNFAIRQPSPRDGNRSGKPRFLTDFDPIKSESETERKNLFYNPIETWDIIDYLMKSLICKGEFIKSWLHKFIL